MSDLLYKKLTTDASTPSDDENLTIYPRLLKTCSYHLTRKLFSQRQISLIQSIALLITICVITLILVQNLAQTSHAETNVESKTAREQTSPRVYASSVARVASEIIPRLIMSRQQMEDVRRDLDSRRQRVTSVCEAIAPKRSYLNDTLTNMIVDTEHNVSWCPIYKAASSTWMNYFVVLKGALTDVNADLVRRNLIQVNDIVRQKFARPDADLNKTYEKMIRTKKFIIVRHPLERLLSAYRDKLERLQGREYYYKRFGRRIVLKYRQSDNRTRLEPTFEEFLRFVVKERYFDEHWAPYYRTCDPCVVHYDYILKFETLERDQNFFVQDADLSMYLYRSNNYSRNNNPRGTTTREILGEYVKEISRELLDEVYKIYENDYKLFDYS